MRGRGGRRNFLEKSRWRPRCLWSLVPISSAGCLLSSWGSWCRLRASRSHPTSTPGSSPLFYPSIRPSTRSSTRSSRWYRDAQSRAGRWQVGARVMIQIRAEEARLRRHDWLAQFQSIWFERMFYHTTACSLAYFNWLWSVGASAHAHAHTHTHTHTKHTLTHTHTYAHIRIIVFQCQDHSTIRTNAYFIQTLTNWNCQPKKTSLQLIFISIV